MLHKLMLLSIGSALASAFALYVVSYQTAGISDGNQQLAREIEVLNRDIAILRAERSYLMRPERLEPFARKLGMRPVRGDQFISKSSLRANMRR